MKGNVGNATNAVMGSIFKTGGGKKPDAVSAAVVNALDRPLDEKALEYILKLRNKSERGLAGAKATEQAVGGLGLALSQQ